MDAAQDSTAPKSNEESNFDPMINHGMAIHINPMTLR